MLYIIRYTLKDGTKQEHLFSNELGLREFYKTSLQYPHRTNYGAYAINLEDVTIKTIKL